jgi:adenylate cyclase
MDITRLAERAIESSKDDPEVLWMAGFVVSAFAGQHMTGIGAIRRALVLNPNSAHAWFASGVVHCYLNQPEQAVEALQRALRLSPLDPLASYFSGFLALAYMLAGRYQEGMECADRSAAEEPRWVPAVRLKAALCGYLGRTEEGRRWINRLLELHPGLTIASFASVATTNAAPELLAVYAEGLRKAGLPEE